MGQADGSVPHAGRTHGLQSVAMFLLVAAAIVVLSPLSGRATSIYGIAALGYLAIKLSMSVAYRPSRSRAPSVSVAVVVPAYNEDPATFRTCLESIRAQTVRPDQVFVVDDGSDDHACSLVALEVFAADRGGVHLIRLHENQGKREAQIRALQRTRADIVVTIDSDTVLDPRAIEEGLRPFADSTVMAVTGDVRVLNEGANVLTRLTSIRYTNAFGWERAAYSSVGSVLCCCGSLSFWRREVIVENIEDYRTQTFLGVPVSYGDDRRLTNYALQRGKVHYQSSSIGYTVVPERLGHFVRQQTRWNKSFFRETLWALRSFSPGGRVWLLSLAELAMWCLMTASLVVAIVLPLVTGRGLSPAYVVFAAAMAWARSVRYLGTGRSSARHQLMMFALAPLYGLLHLVVLVPIRLRSLLLLRDGSWGTRAAVEVGVGSDAAGQRAPATVGVPARGGRRRRRLDVVGSHPGAVLGSGVPVAA